MNADWQGLTDTAVYLKDNILLLYQLCHLQWIVDQSDLQIKSDNNL